MRHSLLTPSLTQLGNVVNGPGPVPDVDEQDSIPRTSFTVSPFSLPGDPWGIWASSQGGSPVQMMPGPGYLSASSSAVDLNFLAAHQQAMAIAKQTYQLAVAQQAMAAAAEEWERGSAVSGMSGGGGSMLAWGNVFPNAPRSVYAGSVGSSPGWGTASLYGENIGPISSRPHSSMMTSHQVPFPPSFYPSSASEGPLSGTKPRQRTRTAPSQGNIHTHVQGSVPPSSWKKAR